VLEVVELAVLHSSLIYFKFGFGFRVAYVLYDVHAQKVGAALRHLSDVLHRSGSQLPR
jgi:hypothetical protein